MRVVFLLGLILPIMSYAVESDITAQNLVDAAALRSNSLVLSNHESGFIKPIPWGSADNANCDILFSADCVSALNSHSSKAKQAVIKPNEPVAYYGANDSYFNPNSSNKYNQNAIANFNITNSNQTAMQGVAPTMNTGNVSPEYLLKQNVSIPFKANNNTLVNVGASKVEFNITY